MLRCVRLKADFLISCQGSLIGCIEYRMAPCVSKHLGLAADDALRVEKSICMCCLTTFRNQSLRKCQHCDRRYCSRRCQTSDWPWHRAFWWGHLDHRAAQGRRYRISLGDESQVRVLPDPSMLCFKPMERECPDLYFVDGRDLAVHPLVHDMFATARVSY